MIQLVDLHNCGHLETQHDYSGLILAAPPERDKREPCKAFACLYGSEVGRITEVQLLEHLK